jgi:hypothetical protein
MKPGYDMVRTPVPSPVSAVDWLLQIFILVLFFFRTMKYIYTLLLFISQQCLSQAIPAKQEDPYKSSISNQVFRAMLNLHVDRNGGLAILGNYEQKLSIPFTLSFKAGPSFFSEEVSPETTASDAVNRYSVRAMASAELKYYFNLKHRIRLEKTTRNFSAAYFSLEPFAISKTLVFLNGDQSDSQKGFAGAYINIGWQKQVRLTYFNIYFGTRFPGPVYSNSGDVFDVIHFGVSIGRVFE